MRTVNDITVSCDEDDHDDCSGRCYGIGWDHWPPMPTEGSCLCECHTDVAAQQEVLGLSA